MKKSPYLRMRNPYFDFIRGLAIIMVVGIHTFTNGDFYTFNGSVNTAIRQILNCAVPLFLALSGFFMEGKETGTRTERKAFWKHQIPKVYIPALVWGLPWFAQSILGGAGFAKSFILWMICGYSVLYFVALIIQYYLLLPVIQRITPSHTWKLITVSSLLSGASIILVTYTLLGRGLPLIVYAGPFPLWIVFFSMGVVLAQSRRNYNLHWIILVSLVALIAQYVEGAYLYKLYAGGFGIKPTSFLFSAAVILLAFSEKSERMFRVNRITHVICFLGKISFPIYLTHCLLISIIRHFVFIDSWLLAWIIVLVIDSLLVLLLQRLLPIRFRKYFGL